MIVVFAKQHGPQQTVLEHSPECQNHTEDARVDCCAIRGIVSPGDGTLVGQPQAEVCGQRGGFLLAKGQAVLRRTTADAGLNHAELRDAAQALGGDLGAVLSVDVVQFSPRMRPAAGQRQRLAADAPGFGQGVKPGLSIHFVSDGPDCGYPEFQGSNSSIRLIL